MIYAVYLKVFLYIYTFILYPFLMPPLTLFPLKNMAGQWESERWGGVGDRNIDRRCVRRWWVGHFQKKKYDGERRIYYLSSELQGEKWYAMIMIMMMRNDLASRIKRFRCSDFSVCLGRECLWEEGALWLQQLCQGTTAMTAGSFAAWLSTELLRHRGKAAYTHTPCDARTRMHTQILHTLFLV